MHYLILNSSESASSLRKHWFGSQKIFLLLLALFGWAPWSGQVSETLKGFLVIIWKLKGVEVLTIVVQSLSRVQIFVTPWTATHQDSQSFTIFLEFAETHVHWVGDAIQPSHPLSPPSLALSLSHHRSLFQWVSSSHQVVKVSQLKLQHQSFQWIFRVDFL